MAGGKTYNFSNPSFGLFRAITALILRLPPLSALLLTLHVCLVCIFSLFLVVVTRLLHALIPLLRHWFLTSMIYVTRFLTPLSFPLTKAVLNLLMLPQPSTMMPLHRPWSRTTEMKATARTAPFWITESANHRCLLLKLQNEILKIAESLLFSVFYCFHFIPRLHPSLNPLEQGALKYRMEHY